jgi:hypothetical protein
MASHDASYQHSNRWPLIWITRKHQQVLTGCGLRYYAHLLMEWMGPLGCIGLTLRFPSGMKLFIVF